MCAVYLPVAAKTRPRSDIQSGNTGAPAADSDPAAAVEEEGTIQQLRRAWTRNGRLHCGDTDP